MFWHVYQRAVRCPQLKRVVLATDDERILAAATALGVPVVMTRIDHASGTDRVLEAAQKLNIGGESVIVNIQGDEPLLDPEMITQLTGPFADAAVQVTTLAAAIDAPLARDPNQVKVVCDLRRRALYFSRAPIPWDRDGGAAAYYGHIGVYAFRLSALRRFSALERGRLEQIEKLEQLRLLENGIPIDVVITQYAGLGVDRPEDIAAVEEILSRQTAGRI